MEIIKMIADMQRRSDGLRAQGKRIGFVPTMGSLHEGHASLIRKAKELADVVVVSIFVNPMQFGPGEDFKLYPRDFERDKATAERSGADILFCPEAAEMYPAGYDTFVEPGVASKILEGSIRPNHFRGVTTVVAKLFNVTKPHVAVFGQKDAQQAFIIRRMVRDLDFDVQVVVAPIVREHDGLAMSSRNVYLKGDERKNALVLSRSLVQAGQRVQAGETSVKKLKEEMHKIISAGSPTKIDYIAFLHETTFEEIQTIVPPGVMIVLAVRFGNTRLIDNAIVGVK